MSGPGADRLRHWIAQAARAPSAHNVQPARWRLHGPILELWEDTSRWLPAGDPQGRDASVALGMAWEGLVLAAGVDGWNLGEVMFDPARYPPGPGSRRRASARLLAGGTVDPLAAGVAQRRSCRRAFEPATAAQRQRLDDVFVAHADIALRIDAARTPAIADAQQAAAIDLLRDVAVSAELYRWLRLSPRHPDVARDGLDAACLELGAGEAFAGRLLMRPAVAAVLARIGLGGLLVDEATKVRGASAIALLAVPAGVDDFSAGRRWYRFWLALTAAGLAAVPMSALVDTGRGRAALAALHPLPSGWRAINVLRIGPAPATPLPVSARLPVDELLVDPARGA